MFSAQFVMQQFCCATNVMKLHLAFVACKGGFSFPLVMRFVKQESHNLRQIETSVAQKSSLAKHDYRRIDQKLFEN